MTDNTDWYPVFMLAQYMATANSEHTITTQWIVPVNGTGVSAITEYINLYLAGYYK